MRGAGNGFQVVGDTTSMGSSWELAEAGSTADWVSAVGQGIGAVLTGVAVVVAIWVALRDGRERDRERRDREKAQARTVFAECRFHQLLPPGSPAIGADAGWLVAVGNFGSEPITQVVIEEVWSVDASGSTRLWLSSNQHHDPVESVTAAEVLAGGERSTAVKISGPPTEIAKLPIKDVVMKLGLGQTSVRATISFVDACGLRWLRVGTQQPERQTS